MILIYEGKSIRTSWELGAEVGDGGEREGDEEFGSGTDPKCGYVDALRVVIDSTISVSAGVQFCVSLPYLARAA